MSSWSFKDKDLIKDGEIIRSFNSDIEKVLPYKGAVIVLLYFSEHEGVYFINFDGSIKWKINSKNHIRYPHTMFLLIDFKNGDLIAYEGGGYDCYIEIETGKVIKAELTK